MILSAVARAIRKQCILFQVVPSVSCRTALPSLQSRSCQPSVSQRSLASSPAMAREGHTQRSCKDLHHMTITVLPANKDNYMYLVVDKATKEAAIVDPADPETVVDAVAKAGVNLTTVLTTHHHWDHSGGNEGLVGLVSGLTVCGGDDRIAAMNKKVNDNDQFKIGKLSVKCLFTPCHTTGHICYYITSEGEEDKAVFTGDTLFIGSCGRFFEGTADQMYKSLGKLAALPKETLMFCGHEYAVAAMTYVAHIDPTNQAAKGKLDWAKEQRQKNLPTVPSTIGEELSFNPFMRVDGAVMQGYAGCSDPVATMKFLREDRNNFKA